MNSLIREAEKKDIPKICELMEELTGHEISEAGMLDRLVMIRNSNIDELFVYEQDGIVQGVLGFRIRENIEEVSRFGEVSVLVTNSDSRRLGIGKAMIAFAEKLAKEKGCIGTWLVSGFGREEAAHSFYKKLGYEINGYRFVKK